MQKLTLSLSLFISLLFSMMLAHAAADMEVNTPAISAIKASMQARHSQLLPHYNSGAVGLTDDGMVAIHDASAVPLKDRAGINSLVGDENADRAKLYKEIAKANAHPEWEGEVRQTFAERWVGKSQAGWWYKKAGDWVKK